MRQLDNLRADPIIDEDLDFWLLKWCFTLLDVIVNGRRWSQLSDWATCSRGSGIVQLGSRRLELLYSKLVGNRLVCMNLLTHCCWGNADVIDRVFPDHIPLMAGLSEFSGLDNIFGSCLPWCLECVGPGSSLHQELSITFILPPIERLQIGCESD